MTGLNLSFRVASSGCLKAILLVIVAVVGLAAPVTCAVWYVYGGGSQWESRRAIRSLVAGNPQQDAQVAVQSGQWSLYTYRDGYDLVVPGIGYGRDELAKTYGYTGLPYLTKESQVTRATLSSEDAQLNERAVEYAILYNKAIVQAFRAQSNNSE